MTDLTHASSERTARIAKSAFTGVMILFVLLALFTGYTISSYLQASGSLRAAANRHTEFDHAATALKDVQRGVRGYLLTSNPEFLAPCEKGRQDAAGAFANLREMLREYPSKREEFERAATLADTLLGNLTREVECIRQGSIDRANDLVLAGESNKAMETIDALFLRLIDEDRVLVNSETLHAEDNLSRAFLFLIVGGGLNFVVIIAIFAALQRQLRDRTSLSDILEKSEGRLNLIIRSMQEGLTFSNSDGTFEIFTPRMGELTGYSKEEANLSSALRDRLKVDPARDVDNPWTRDPRGAAPGTFTFEKEIETRRGDRKILRGCARILDESGASMLLTTYQDVTGERQAQEDLRVQNAYFQRLFESMPEGVALIDDHGKIRSVNTAYETMFGFSRNEILDRDFTTLTVPKELIGEAVKALEQVMAGEGLTFETRRRKQDGTMINVSIIATRVDLAAGQRMSYGIYRDITERKKAEKERDRLVSELLHAVAEIKTLTGLLPICAWCKKVRDNHGYYHQIEDYVARHSDATFTHGICPECADKFDTELVTRVR